MRLRLRRAALAASLAALAGLPGGAMAADRPGWLAPCRLDGVEHEALCGVLRRPLAPSAAAGPQIELHLAVLPALARQRLADPVFVLAGGPGQSAIDLAGPMSRLLARTLNRRDVVLVDQRGTGRSAPLHCPAPAPAAPLAEALDPQRQAARLQRCREGLERLPHGDLRQFTTPIAAQDLEAVRQALGLGAINLLAVSYGTRLGLEYLRQFPGAVRRAVLDGVVPPDRALPASASADSQAALDGLLALCEADERCGKRHPGLAARWRAWLGSLPREVRLEHPLTGQPETLLLDREAALSLVRAPLYLPAQAAALPTAMAEALAGRLGPLAALAAAAAPSSPRPDLPPVAEGLHFSVVCSEDMPLLESGPGETPGGDFGAAPAAVYRRACEGWPRGALPEGFRRLGPAASPVLLLAGGRDPATPPRHAERVAAALGPLARPLTAPNAGHGLIALPCMREVLQQFLDAPGAAAALAVDAACLQALPAPRLFLPPPPEAAP